MWHKIKSLLFHNHTIRQTVAKNTFWLAVSNFGGRFLRAAIVIYGARVLGTSEWGVFSYAISFVTLLTAFADIGISPLLIRESSKLFDDPEQQRKVISTSFILKGVLIVLGMAVVVFGGPFFTSIEGVKAILPIAALIFAFDSMREFGTSLIRSFEKMEWEAGLYLLTNAAIVVLGFIFLYESKTVGALTYAYAAGTGIGMIATIYAIKDKLAGLFSNFSFTILKSIFASGWPLAISVILGMLMINTDILLIGWFQSADSVGLYSAAQRIVQLLYLVPAIITMSILPALSRLAGKDDIKLRRVLELVLSFLFIAALPIAVGGILLGKEIIGFVFGNAYLAGTSSFQVLIATILIDFPVVVLSNVAFAYNRQKSLIVYSAIGGISNVIFDLILIPKFGIVGSAWATFLAQLLCVAYLRRIAYQENRPKILPHLRKAFIATMIMALTILILNSLGIHVVITILISALVYFGTILALKEPLLKEIKLITSLPSA